MIVIEGFDTGIQYEFSNASELLEFLDEQLTRWWMEGDLVVGPVGPAFIRISCNPEPNGEKSQCTSYWSLGLTPSSRFMAALLAYQQVSCAARRA